MRIVAAVLLISGLSQAVYAAAPSADKLDKPLARYKEERAARGLRYFCAKIARMPCGQESMPQKSGEARTEVALLNMASTTPRKVLDAIVGQTPGTRWEVRSGVINVEPVSRTGEDLLGKKLASFSARGVSSFQAAMDAFEEAGISASYEEMGRRRFFGEVDLDLKDVSVRDVLNAIVKADGDLMWVFVHTGNPEANIKGTLLFFTERKSGAKTSSGEWKKTKRWKREQGGKKPAQ